MNLIINKITKSLLSLNKKNIIKLPQKIKYFLNEKYLKNFAEKLFISKKFCIFCYHNVTDELIDNSLGINISTNNFFQQIKLINKYFHVCTFNDLLNSQTEKFNKSPVVITFDDAYEGIYKNAFPILKKFNNKAVLFISPYFIENQKYFWWDVIYNFLKKLPISNQVFHLLDNFYYTKLNFTSVWQAFDYIRNQFYKMNIESIYRILENNFGYLEYNYPEMRATTWQNIKEMMDYGFEIGNHSYCHSMLSTFNEDELLKDFNKSKKMLYENLHITPNIYSIPFGHEMSYNSYVDKIFHEKKYILATINVTGNNDTSNILNNFYLKRYTLNNLPYICIKFNL